MLPRRRSGPEKPVFGMKTDRTNKGNGEAEWLQGHGWRTLGHRTYEVIRWLHPKQLMMLLASAMEHVKRIAMVVIHGRSCRRTRLLTWFSEQLRRGGGCAAAQWASLEPCDLRAVWREGALLCALVDALVPGACPEHPGNNIAVAQEAVSKQWALPPAFTDDELLQVTFSSHFERRLLRYLSAIQQASERLPGASDRPTLGSDADADARMSGPYASASRASAACVARGMGLFTATQYRRASFLLYLLDAEPSDVFVVIQTERDFGFARVGQHGCVLPSRYSNIPIMISRDTGSGTRVTFTPQSCGQHELVILRKGVHIPGSPFCIPVEKTTKVGSVEKEDLQTPVRRKRLRVLLRTVDFVTEKMILTDDGKLKKIPPSFLDEHLTAMKEGKSRRNPEIYIYVSEEGSTMHQVWGSSPGCSDADSEHEGDSKVTENSQDRQLTDSPHIPRHDGVGRGKCLQRQRNLDSTRKKAKDFQGSTGLAKSTEFQSRCKKIITMCKFVLEKSRKSHGLSLLNAFHKIIDGRPIRMTDEVEVMLKRLSQSLPPPTSLEPIADPGKLQSTETEEMPNRDLDRRLSPSPPAGDAGNTCDVALQTQIKCFEDKLAYCNNYIESVLQQNTTLQTTTELLSPQRSNNSAVKKDFEIEPRDVRMGEPIDAEPSPSPSPSPSPITDPFNSNEELDYFSTQSKIDCVTTTDGVKLNTTISVVEPESGDHSPRSGSNLEGFRPASSSSPSSMSETSTEGAAAIFPDLDAFLSCQFTKYMASETQFHLWPSDVAFGDVQDTICAMEDDEMIDFDAVISAPNLEDALVKLEQGLRKKSTAKRESELNSKDEAMAVCSEDGETRTTRETIEKVVSDDAGKPSTHINKTEPVDNADSKLDVCQADECIEKDCDQNRSPDRFECVVNPPDQEAGPGEDHDPDSEEADDVDDVDSNPSPQAGHPSVEGWDSAYLSIDDLKGSPENRLSNNLVAGNHSAGNDSRDKHACWPENSNMALAGFMGPAEKEIWGYEEEQDDDVDQLSGASFYPRVLTPLTKMMSLILEEDEEKIMAFANVEKGEMAGKSFTEMQQSDTKLTEVRNVELQSKELVTGMRITNGLESWPSCFSDPERDCNGNSSAKLYENVQIFVEHSHTDSTNENVQILDEHSPTDSTNENLQIFVEHSPTDSTNENVHILDEHSTNENTDNKLDSNLDELLLGDLDCDLDCDIDQSLDDTLDEDVSVAFDALIAEQLDLFEQGSDFDSALAEALQVSALQEKITSPVLKSVDSTLQQGSKKLQVLEESRELPAQKERTELPEQQESTELPEQKESTELPEQKESTELPVQKESKQLPVQKESKELPEQKGSTELPEKEESKELPEQKESTELPEQKEITEVPLQKESTDFPSRKENTELPAKEERAELPVPEESIELQVQGESVQGSAKVESVQLSAHSESKEFPVQGKSAVLQVLEESTDLPVQNHIDVMCIDWPVQQAGTEMPAPVDCCVQPDLTDSTVCKRTKVDKLVTKNIPSIQNDDDEKVQKEPNDLSIVFVRNDACFPIPKLTVEVEATGTGSTPIENYGFGSAIISTKEHSEYPSKSCKNFTEGDTTIMVEQAEIQCAVLPSDIEEIVNKIEQECKEGSIDELVDESIDDKCVEKVSALTSVSTSSIGKCFPTKQYVTFKKDYWDRKVQMLDLVGKHSQPRSTGTSQEPRKTQTHSTYEQSDDCTLSTVDSIKPPSTIRSKTDVKNCEILPRSPSLYRARRVLVSEDSDDGASSEGQTKTHSRRHQGDDEGSKRKNTSTKDVTQVAEAEDLKTERLRGKTKCKDGDLSILVEYPQRKSRQSSDTEGMPTGSTRKKLRSRKGTEDVGTDSRQDDNFVDSCKASSLRRDSPQKMKERFQSAKQFFQSLEKNSGQLSRGLSSESDGGSLWESKGAGWRGPFGGSERVRVPRRCHIKDLF